MTKSNVEDACNTNNSSKPEDYLQRVNQQQLESKRKQYVQKMHEYKLCLMLEIRKRKICSFYFFIRTPVFHKCSAGPVEIQNCMHKNQCLNVIQIPSNRIFTRVLTYSGQHQNLWSLNGPSAQNNFISCKCCKNLNKKKFELDSSIIIENREALRNTFKF